MSNAARDRKRAGKRDRARGDLYRMHESQTGESKVVVVDKDEAALATEESSTAKRTPQKS